MNKNMNKNINSRNMMNDKINDFITPNYLNKNNTNIDISNFQNESIIYDKNNSKNDINTRLNSFQDYENLNLRRLPFNNNIRDYIVTVDSKRDEFNDRLSNYNKLSTNINPNFNTNNFNSYSFHNNFKDINNKRMEELSPLARNVGLPINQKKPKNIDFSNNIEKQEPFTIAQTFYNNENTIDNDDKYQENNTNENKEENEIFGNENNLNNYSLLNDGINNLNPLNYNTLYYV